MVIKVTNFIFYDDCDYQIRAQRAGFEMVAVRDALMRRQFDFVQSNDLASWKGFYMYRNLFVVHFRYGTNVLVRAKPFLLTAGVIGLSPVRGGFGEVRNVVRALVSGLGMIRLDERARLN